MSANVKSNSSPNDPAPNGPPPPYAPPNVVPSAPSAMLVDKKDEKKADVKSILQAPYFVGAMPTIPSGPNSRCVFVSFARIGVIRIDFNFGNHTATQFWSAIFTADYNRCVEKGYTTFIDAGLNNYVKAARSAANVLLLPTSMTRQSNTSYRAFVDYYWPITTSTIEPDVLLIGPRKIYEGIQFDVEWTP